MTRTVRFSKNEIANAVRLSKAEGVAVKLTRDGAILIFPDFHKPGAIDPSEDDILDAELAAFEAEHDDG